MPQSDTQTGTPVTLVVSPHHVAPGGPPGAVPGHTSPPPSHGHIPFTGFELVPALAVGAVLVAAGGLLGATSRRRPAPVRVRTHRSTR